MSTLFGAHGLGDWTALSAFNVLHFWPWFIIATIAATPLPKELLAKASAHRAGALAYGIAMSGMLVWSVSALVIGGFNPFIYFRF